MKWKLSQGQLTSPARGPEWQIPGSWYSYTSNITLSVFIRMRFTRWNTNFRQWAQFLTYLYVLHLSISVDANKETCIHSTRQVAKAPKMFTMVLIFLFSLMQHSFTDDEENNFFILFLNTFYCYLLPFFLLYFFLFHFACSFYLHPSSSSVLQLIHLRIVPSLPYFRFSTSFIS